MIAIRKNPLTSLSDSQIIRCLDDLVQKERETTIKVLLHIIEFDRRKLYLGIGYSSLYNYCVMHLGYSESAAMRRIKTSRIIREFPEIYSMLEANELNLTGVCLLADILTPENKNELLEQARCKSKRQIEAIVAMHNPGRKIRDRVRILFESEKADRIVQRPGANIGDQTIKQGPGSYPGEAAQQNWVKFTSAGGGKKSTVERAGASGGVSSADIAALHQKKILKKKFKLEFAVDPECMKKVKEAKALLSKKYPEGVSLGTLLEEALDAYLDKHSPKRKKQRREKRKATNEAKKNGRQNAHIKAGKPINTFAASHSGAKSKMNSMNKRSRHIPQAIQDAVASRDEGRCTFMGPDGVRCNSIWNLEIDHIVPYARGGTHSMENLRLLCAKHNKHIAEKCYGREFINRRVQGHNPRRE
jgi:hypothetical protein